MESDVLRQFVVYDLQLVALTLFALLYAVKIWQLSRLPVPRELPPARGNVARSVAFSYAAILSPASMESTRRQWGHWLAFIAYHAGILVAILATFTIPFWPAVMTPGVRRACAVLIGLAFVAGAFKLAWRLGRAEMRYISTPDDYFSLVVLQIWFVLAVPAILFEARGWLPACFGLTAALLIYVPLSKISQADQIRESGAKVVVTSCDNCRHQLSDLSEHYGLGIEVKNLAEVTAEALI